MRQTRQCRSADFQADVSFQNHTLPMQRCVIAYLLTTVSIPVELLQALPHPQH